MHNDTEPPPPLRLTFAVNAARLASGRFDHGRNRDIGEGDINASYSADRIASAEPIRKPFQHDGSLWICTSVTSTGLTASGSTEHEAYRLLPARLFNGTPTTYSAKTSTVAAAEAARNDPNGFYHGVAVKFAREAFILCGPPLRFIPANAPSRPGAAPERPEPEQLALF